MHIYEFPCIQKGTGDLSRASRRPFAAICCKANVITNYYMNADSKHHREYNRLYAPKLSMALSQGLLSTAGNVVAWACTQVLVRTGTGDLSRAFSDTGDVLWLLSVRQS
jgi:hypothetical protein